MIKAKKITIKCNDNFSNKMTLNNKKKPSTLYVVNVFVDNVRVTKCSYIVSEQSIDAMIELINTWWSILSHLLTVKV